MYVPILGKGGRVASGLSLSQFVSKNLAVKNLDDSNPRESILRHAKVKQHYNLPNYLLELTPFSSTQSIFLCY